MLERAAGTEEAMQHKLQVAIFNFVTANWFLRFDTHVEILYKQRRRMSLFATTGYGHYDMYF